MNISLSGDTTIILAAFLLLLGGALLITAVLALYAIWWVRRINLPPYAGFIDALRATPLVVVVVLDLLDLTLDIFSAPITWLLLGRLGLAPLRAVAVIKDLIPFTNFVPLMTLSWLYARYMTNEKGAPTLEHVRHLRNRRSLAPIKPLHSSRPR